MGRLNMTLDAVTLKRLEKYAEREKMAVAAVARCLLIEAMERREELAHRKKLAADYARGRDDARELLGDLERPQLEGLLDDA